MRLSDVAHVRSGDKGNTSQISVIAYDPADYPLLVRTVTTERVLGHLALLSGVSASRFEIPGLAALNFVLNGALAGGVTRSLALDAHGKALGTQLLDLPIDPLPQETP